ncbi:MAG: CPXCG motif-containing cysteine-rich protein [Pseudomonadota bacterium]
MSGFVSEARAQCPFCFESVDLFIDISAGGQTYIEDCPVCCRPYEVRFEADAEGVTELQLDRAD